MQSVAKKQTHTVSNSFGKFLSNLRQANPSVMGGEGSGLVSVCACVCVRVHVCGTEQVNTKAVQSRPVFHPAVSLMKWKTD